ncbi:SAF domain-containing protein [Georgenia wangjunii]|uniref:SAF domain-containing protein n=1 Tax=Georgenia wangjunii TaxID=3117730 RepID=UPI002F26D07F
MATVLRERVLPSRGRSARLRRWAWRCRHVVLAVALALCVGVVLAELRPPPPRTEPVLVLARDVPAGAVLTGADLAVRQAGAGSVPAHALRAVGEAEGATLAVGLPAGFPLAGSVLVGPGLADGAPPGLVVVPVRLADPGVVAMLRPGDRVDLLAATADAAGTAGPAEVVAAGALVLARHEEAGAGLLGAGAEAPLVLVALPPPVAAAVVGASAWAPLRVVLTRQ